MRIVRKLLPLLLCTTLVLLLSQCGLGLLGPTLDARFVFEVQVLDSEYRTIPIRGATVHMKSYIPLDWDKRTIRGLQEWTLTTDDNGWAVAYPRYRVKEREDLIFKAALREFNFEEDAVGAHVVYGNLQAAADENDRVNWRVSLWLYQ